MVCALDSCRDREVHVQALAGVTVLCSWARYFTLTVPLSTPGPVVRKPINTNPGLKVKQAFNFSCIKVFFSANVL